MLLKSFAGGRALLPVALVLAVGVVAQQPLAPRSGHTVSPAVQSAADLGPVERDQDITLTVYLKLPSQAAFEAAVQKLYEPESPTYHQWMTNQDIQKFAPSAADLKTVQQELEKNGLSVKSIDPHGFSIRVHGTAGNVEKAFQTQLHTLSLKGKTFRAHIVDAKLTGTAGSLVASVSGLDQHTVKPLYKRAVNPRTNLSPPHIALAKANASGLGAFITDKCLYPPQTVTYPTPGASLPVGVYYGNVYNLQDANGRYCDFSPAQLQAHYGLTAAYKAGLDGGGWTIVLLEGYGYPTAEADANAFFKLVGLPPLTSSNFKIVYPDGVPNPGAGIYYGWDGEIALDLQWAHSMAPGAKIVLVATNGQDNEDFQYAMNYVIDNGLGHVISDSWEEDQDLFAGFPEEDSYTAVLAKAAAQGFSFQFSSGDGGDDGIGTPIGAAEVPSNNPYATAVGGTSILNSNTGSGFWEVGWGDDFSLIAAGGVQDPPEPLGFFGGAGGGESIYFAKPWWQSKLPGAGRQVPDISALADPYTGVPIVLTATEDGVTAPYLFVTVGGTSLASPIVTAILAIANQKAGKPLGQAAPLIASLPSGAVKDILPLSSPTNLSGIVVDSNGSTYYSPVSLFSPFIYPAQVGFISANWPFDALDAEPIAFAIDSSLAVTTGWDNVTGFGVPNGLTFIDALAKK
jgi:subtilase family serine protease